MLRTRSRTARDCLFLSTLVIIAASTYLPHLGFYSDDWAFLGLLTTAQGHSFIGLFRSLDIGFVKPRPAQLVYMVLLFKAFGLEPFWYHVVNMAVLVSVSVLLYLVLRSMDQQRAIAISVSAIFAMLPHYSTTRFWYAAFEVNLSLALYLISLFADLKMLRSKGARLWIWKAVALWALICSALAYELAMPLSLLNVLIVWQLNHRMKAETRAEKEASTQYSNEAFGSRRLSLLLGSNVFVLLMIAGFKVSTTDRFGQHSSLYEHARFYLHIVKAAARMSFGTYGIGLPRVIWKIWHQYPNKAAAGVAVIAGAGLMLYLLQITRRSTREPMANFLETKSVFRLCLLGAIVFGLGYAIFLTNENVQISPTGIANRVNSVAAIGVALLLTGVIGAIADRMPTGWNRVFFCSTVAALCACNVAINTTIATFWVSAYQKEQATLHTIYEDLPHLPQGSTVLLDGLCPYDGPAIVFESNWDLQGALILHYHDLSLFADVVTPDLRIGDAGFSTLIYGDTTSYKYRENVFVYDLKRRRTYPLVDVAAARQYFGDSTPGTANGCPKGEAGYGVSIF